MTAACPLCTPQGETVLWRDARLRVIHTPQPGHPGFCRVIWHAHVREMTDLPPAQRAHLMAVVWAVEETLREMLRPAKINLASLGNQVPHLHWHVIPRYEDDPHFPDAVWAAPRRPASSPPALDTAALAARLAALIDPLFAYSPSPLGESEVRGRSRGGEGGEVKNEVKEQR